MDASAVERYRYLLAAFAAALVLGLLAAVYLSRRSAPLARGAEPSRPGTTQLLPPVMLMLVALVVGAGMVLLLPVAMIVRFFAGGPVAVLVLGAVLLMSWPLLYAWRSRPF